MHSTGNQPLRACFPVTLNVMQKENMKPQILKVKGEYFLYWDEDLLKVKLTEKYAKHYGGAIFILECDEKFTYDTFKKLKGSQFPDNFCVSSYCKINYYSPVFILYISKVDSKIVYKFRTSYDLDEWEEDIHLKRFCGKLWEAFNLAGFKTEDRPELEDGSFHIQISVEHHESTVIEDAVETTCNMLKEIHASVFANLCGNHIDSITRNDFQVSDVVKITKYKGKFFEIDIPKIIEKIFNKNNA